MFLSSKFTNFREKLKSKTGRGNQAPERTPKTAQSVATPPETPKQKAVSDPSIPPDTDIEPWARAYEIVQNREPELVQGYVRHLVSLQDEGENAVNTDLSTPKSVESTMKKLIDIRKEKQWRVSLFGKEVRIREKIEMLEKFIVWSEPFVTKAVSAHPYAALGWAGVALFLPLLTSGSESNESMLQGFNSLAEVQIFWRVCENSYLKGSHIQEYQELHEPLAKLYSYIIEFQASAIYHLSKRQISRAWKDVTGSNNWEGIFSTINDLDQQCKSIIPHLTLRESRKESNRMLDEMHATQLILKDISTGVEATYEQSQTYYEEENAKDLLRDLKSDHTINDYKNFNPEKIKGTCEWFFKDERFCQWRAATSSSILWVSASPGCGKSVLARALIDENRLFEQGTTSTVCHFFFKDGIEHRMSATDAMGAILHQIFTKHPEKSLMIQHALDIHKELGQALTKSFADLWQIFMTCVESPKAGEIVVVLDALDECKSDSWRLLLINLNKASYANIANKILITSRPYDDLTAGFQGFSKQPSYVPFDGDDKSTEISQEINLVIDARVEEIAQDFEENDRQTIANKLKSMKNRTYLWLHLTFDIIKQSPFEYGRRVDVEELLSSLPSQVSEAYEKILGRTKSSEKAVMLLEIVLAAARPLTIEEANMALTLALSKKKYASHAAVEKDSWTKARFSRDVKSLCGLLISVTDSKLFFIHQTAREFLIHPERKGEWQGRLKSSDAHTTMSLTCLRYLSLLHVPITSEQTLSNFPLANYSAHNWMEHARRVETVQDVQKAILNFFHQGGQPYLNWGLIYKPEYHWLDQVTEVKLHVPLYYASQGGLQHTTQCLVDEYTEINPLDSTWELSLWAAAKNGHATTVQLILATKVRIGPRFYQEILFRAAEDGEKEIVVLLLDSFKANATCDSILSLDYCHRQTFFAAISCGRIETVQLMLERLNADTLGTDYYLGLYGASLQGHTEIVALLVAATHGHIEIVHLLLDYTDVNTRDESDNKGRNVLRAAAINGHKEIVKLLLTRGADVNIPGGNCSRAIEVAAANGQVEIVQLLLDKANFVTLKECYGYTLRESAKYGHAQIVQQLLKKTALFTKSEAYGASSHAIQLAATYGQKETARILLDRAEFNTLSELCGNSIEDAAASGAEEIVRLLLSYGVRIDKTLYGNAIMSAAAHGHTKTLQLLLERADPSSSIDYDRSLLNAVENGHKENVELLIAHGADVNAYGSYGTALRAASRFGHSEVVQLLLVHGAGDDD
ncbi:unnamed protein product [Penicillium salamii]|uniref:NWD NACHT-NTPase N-terminal domain-containing protein n=1 Tax=Penicillium salamii TaxID=1612424 RepID=A0A9W4IDU5_9EURO|nr:unnamed protein product [Penicillium salamii]